MSNLYKKTKIIAKANICDSERVKSAAIADLKHNKNSKYTLDGVDDRYVEDQQDLIIVESILVSTGMNKNDDVFLPNELMKVQSTGRHKPVNVEHQDEKIVGHMIESFATDKDGNRIGDNINEPDKMPAAFDLTNRAVIYAYVFPQLAHEIREKASDNELFVSVEVWYKNYDYLVDNSVVNRNKSTAKVFDPVLRINGGTGFVDGAKVGRVLREMLIAGVGLVKNPANEESIIKTVSNREYDCNAEYDSNINIPGLIDEFRVGYFNSEEVEMSKIKAGEKKETSAAKQSEETTEDLDKQEEVTGKAENSNVEYSTTEDIKTTEEESVESKNKNDVENTGKTSATANDGDIDQETADEDEGEDEAKKSESADSGELDNDGELDNSSDDEISDLKKEISNLKDALTEQKEKFDATVAELKDLKKEKLHKDRIDKTVDVLSVDKTKASKLVDKTISLTNEAFTDYLKDLLEMFGDKSKSSQNGVENENVESDNAENDNDTEDGDVEDAVDKALENAKKEEDNIDFKQGEAKESDLVSKFGGAVSKFIKKDKEE